MAVPGALSTEVGLFFEAVLSRRRHDTLARHEARPRNAARNKKLLECFLSCGYRFFEFARQRPFSAYLTALQDARNHEFAGHLALFSLFGQQGMACFRTQRKLLSVPRFAAHDRALLAVRAILLSRYLARCQFVFEHLDSREFTVSKELWLCPLSGESGCLEQGFYDSLLADSRLFQLVTHSAFTCRRARFHELWQRHTATFLRFLEKMLQRRDAAYLATSKTVERRQFLRSRAARKLG